MGVFSIVGQRMGIRDNDRVLPGDREDLPSINSEDGHWLRRVRQAYDASTDFLDAGIRTEWENSLSRFHSHHPNGSKYHSKQYKSRSKIFRPKTRSNARRSEAKAAKALFSNTDLIDVRGQSRGNATQAASARLNKALLQYRLEHSIPWFLTCIGARQDTFNYGVCISMQGWQYQETNTKDLIPVLDPETGEPMVDEDGIEIGDEVDRTEVVKDQPFIDLLPPENVRFDANADWRNPFDDSPVVQAMLPMFATDVMERMEDNGYGETWREYGLGEILAASQDKSFNEVIRQARTSRGRQDPQDILMGDENSVVWVILNFVREGAKDYAFYTLGQRLMLTDPMPAEELIPLGRQCLTFGFSIIEAHRSYPVGGNTLAEPMQSELNDIANQRMDNVKLALNKRFVVRRGAQVDTHALMRSVPGGGVMAQDPTRDVRVLEYNDVTGSSYQEQDRISNEMDELTGNFSGSSVQSNRQLNETVGGMAMLQGDASEVAEYELRVFIESWVEPVLRKMQKLEAMFETDTVIMAVAAENAELFQRYGEDLAVDELIDHELTVSVNVGMGNTNPMMRLQQFQGTLTFASTIPEVAQRLNAEEIGKEIFSLAGFNDTERFFLDEEQMKAKQEQMQPPPDPQLEVAKLRAEAAIQERQIQMEADLQEAQLRAESDRYSTDREYEAAMAKIAAERDIKLNDMYERLGMERFKVQSQRDIAALKEGNRTREMNVKRDMGSGI